MASRFVQLTDFEYGRYAIPTTGESENDLQLYIEENEEDRLKEILGCELYESFITDWDSAPLGELSEQRFIDIYNKFCIDYNCQQLKSKGIKDMLIAFIYYDYMKDQSTSKRINGPVKSKNDNSEPARIAELALFKPYNDAVRTYKAIQLYIYNNPNDYDYSSYNGEIKEFMSLI